MKRAAKGAALQAVTANLLSSGAVAFRAPGGAWTASIAEAEVAAGPDNAQALLAAANQDARRNIVVEPYLIDVTREGRGVLPSVLREAIRTSGPTIVENAVTPARASA